MLHREYMPFLPTHESVPQGPVEKPLLEARAPDGWWEESAAELFASAENIAWLLHEASECGVPLMTPFVGFCAFSAGYLLVYIYRFPNMNLGRSPRAEECMNMCLDYLEEFRHIWKIADGWVISPSLSTYTRPTALLLTKLDQNTATRITPLRQGGDRGAISREDRRRL